MMGGKEKLGKLSKLKQEENSGVGVQMLKASLQCLNSKYALTP